jgi:hypothetical protein
MELPPGPPLNIVSRYKVQWHGCTVYHNWQINRVNKLAVTIALRFSSLCSSSHIFSSQVPSINWHTTQMNVIQMSIFAYLLL